jgi:hypothetical protein
VEAVEAVELARMGELDVTLFLLGRTFRLGWCGVPGHIREVADPPPVKSDALDAFSLAHLSSTRALSVLGIRGGRCSPHAALMLPSSTVTHRRARDGLL